MNGKRSGASVPHKGWTGTGAGRICGRQSSDDPAQLQVSRRPSLPLALPNPADVYRHAPKTLEYPGSAPPRGCRHRSRDPERSAFVLMSCGRPGARLSPPARPLAPPLRPSDHINYADRKFTGSPLAGHVSPARWPIRQPVRPAPAPPATMIPARSIPARPACRAPAARRIAAQGKPARHHCRRHGWPARHDSAGRVQRHCGAGRPGTMAGRFRRLVGSPARRRPAKEKPGRSRAQLA
jgi:hypothetical protein